MNQQIIQQQLAARLARVIALLNPPEYYRTKAAGWKLLRGYSTGVVLFNTDGHPTGWSRELPPASHWEPGVVADTGTALYVAVGGDAQDGAYYWEQFGGGV